MFEDGPSFNFDKSESKEQTKTKPYVDGTNY